MNLSFAIIVHNGLSLLVYRPWWEEGILHGMTLRPLSFTGELVGESFADFYRATGTTLLAHPKQTHGDRYFDAREGNAVQAERAVDGSLSRFGEFDALIAPTSQNLPGEQIAYGIATADCVPIVMRGRSAWGLVHAGWRGLANGIVPKVARALGEVQEVAIFACAGGSVYEVGDEVVDAIGDCAVCTRSADGRSLLDTAETAKKLLLPFVAADRIDISGICTILDTRFHSHRRDRDVAGRSITFVCPTHAKERGGYTSESF
jgi:copper oxidase (laccase) domain-containing protein